MKLRNKKTGEIIEDECLANIIQKLYDRGDVICSGPLLSMGLFAEYWEEIGELEPLIDCKKYRKAIRTWAEAVGHTKFIYDGIKDCIYVPDCDNTVSISFDRYSVFEKLKHGHLYTITELCGEEKC